MAMPSDPLVRLDVRERVLAIALDCVPDGDCTLAGVVEEAMLKLERDHPVLMERFRQEMAESAVREILRQRLNEGRLAFYRNQRPLLFQRATAEYERTGDAETAFGPIMEARMTVDSRNTRRKIRDMTKADCNYVASNYQTSAEQAALKAAVWRKVGERIPEGGVVSDVFDEASLAALMNAVAQ